MTTKNSTNTGTDIVEKLCRSEVLSMIPYESARRLAKGAGNFNNKIWLNANEAAGSGNYQIKGDCLNRYPDFQPDNLLDAYSAYAEIDKSNILATRGADEGIELIIRTFCTAYRDNILICPPTYGMYAISAENHGAGVIKVPLTSNRLNVPEIIEQLEQVNVVFLCSPGNPTGNLLPRSQIVQVLEASLDKAMVVVDEAYIEFSPKNSVQDLLAKYPHLIILRTLSKAFALAGLRCGFTLSSSKVISLLSKVIAPYPVPTPVAEMASKALATEGLLEMAFRVKETNYFREQLIQWLTIQPWCVEVFPSDANFVLFKCQDKARVFSSLNERGILIRDQSKQAQLANCLRITIGNERELNVLKQVLTETMCTSKNSSISTEKSQES
jgi:histidinol-phosphate aminotransferase